MSDILVPRIIVNPTSHNIPISLPELFKHQIFFEHYKPILQEDSVSKKKSEIVFTHPIFCLEKPERLSQKTQQTKPKGTYYVVFNPEPLGAGQYGAVYPVLGVWKLNEGHWIFKSKSDPNKERLVKTNVFRSRETSKAVSKTYKKEFKLGTLVPHMGYKYPVIQFGDKSLLLSRKQNGISLETLLQQLSINPNLYSVSDRLKLCINLLTELENQVNGITIPTTNNHIVHCDIKPANVIVDTDLTVKYIDFGLATPNSNKKSIPCTPLYADPRLFCGAKTYVDYTSDLASVSRVIAELWGDKSGASIKLKNDLVNRNSQNKLIRLFEGISDLSDQEKLTLTAIIKSGTEYQEANRLSRKSAIELFKKCLTLRLEKENNLLKALTASKPEDLTEDKLYFILKSPKASEYLLKYKEDPDAIRSALTQLGPRLFDLNEKVLRTIAKQFMDCSSPALMLTMLKQNISPEQLQTLIKLGTSVSDEALNFWLNKAIDPGQKLNWVSICRILYSNNSNAKDLIMNIKNQDSFNYEFCNLFISNQRAPLDDVANIRILTRHMQISTNNNQKALLIEDLLENNIPEKPFASALMSKIRFFLFTQPFQLVDDPDIDRIYQRVTRLTSSLKKLNSLSAIPGMAHRDSAINTLVEKMNHRLNCSGKDDWSVVLDCIPTFADKCDAIMDLDASRKRLIDVCPANVLNIISTELDTCFMSPKTSAYKLITRGPNLRTMFKLINEINLIRDNMFKKGVSFSPESTLEKEYNSMLSAFSIYNEQQNRLKLCLELYSSCSKLFNEIQKQTGNLDMLSMNSFKSIVQIEAAAHNVLPKTKAAQFAEEVRAKSLEMIEKLVDEKKQKRDQVAHRFFPAALSDSTNGDSTQVASTMHL